MPTGPLPTLGGKILVDKFLLREYIVHIMTERVDSTEVGQEYLVRAIGLEGSKGTIVARTSKELHEVIDEFVVQRIYGRAGDRVIITPYHGTPENPN